MARRSLEFCTGLALGRLFPMLNPSLCFLGVLWRAGSAVGSARAGIYLGMLPGAGKGRIWGRRAEIRAQAAALGCNLCRLSVPNPGGSWLLFYAQTQFSSVRVGDSSVTTALQGRAQHTGEEGISFLML